MRVACWLDDPYCPVETECVALMEAAASALSNAGAHIDYDARPDVDFEFNNTSYLTLLTSMMTPTNPRVASMTIADTAKNSAERWSIKQKWMHFFEDFDVLLCPIMPCTAMKHQHIDYAAVMAGQAQDDRTVVINGETFPYLGSDNHIIKWAGLVIYSDLPSTVVPVGRDSNGLPFGIQIVAAPWKDLQTIEVGKMLERLGFGYEPPPGFDDAAAEVATSRAKL